MGGEEERKREGEDGEEKGDKSRKRGEIEGKKKGEVKEGKARERGKDMKVKSTIAMSTNYCDE